MLFNFNYRFVLLILFNLFLFCEKEKPVIEKKVLPSQVTTDFELTESVRGKKLYTILAPKALLFEEREVIEVIKPKILFYDEEGDLISILECDSGIVFQRTLDLKGKGNLKVMTEDSTYLYTDSLVWNNERRVIVTETWVKIKTKTSELLGIGLESDAGLSKIKIKKEIKGKTSYEIKG